MSGIVKIAGGKARVIGQIAEHFGDGRIVEPFAGSLTTAFALSNREFLFNDSNTDLYNLYSSLRLQMIVDSEQFWQGKNNPEDYYKVREGFNNSSRVGFLAAKRFLYLNRHSYNGLIRYNLSGGFNTPFGKYKNPYFPHEEMRAYRYMQENGSTSETCLDYIEFMDAFTKVGDTVYCDPPYLSPSGKSTFQYTPDGKKFEYAQHVELATKARELADLGRKVIISNAYIHDSVTSKLYGEADRVLYLDVRRSISCKDRGNAKELIAIYE